MKNKLASDLKYLRDPKSPNYNEDKTKKLEDKYLDTKKPFPEYSDEKKVATKRKAFERLDDVKANNAVWNNIEELKKALMDMEKEAKVLGDDLSYKPHPSMLPAMKKEMAEYQSLLADIRAVKKQIKNLEQSPSKRNPLAASLKYLANEKEAGALMDRMQQNKEPGISQQLTNLIGGAFEKFRSLVFEIKGTNKVVEVAKTGTGLDMKIFEDKDSPTPSSEKKFQMPEFINFFMQKIAPSNAPQVARELASKGIAEVSTTKLASIKAALKKKSWNLPYPGMEFQDNPVDLENRTYQEALDIYNDYSDGAMQVEETSPEYFKLILNGKTITEGDDIEIARRIKQMNREMGYL